VPTGVVKGRELKKNRDGVRNVLVIQAEVSDPDDLQSVELVTQAGEDYNPPDDSRIIIADLGPGFKVSVACDDGIEPSASVGERRLYSISGGAVAAIIHLLADGTVELNGGGGTAVEFARLKTAFDQLKSDFDTLVGIYNGHVHPGVTAGAASTGTTPAAGSTSTANIDPAESDTVTLP
jgi:hypothetical protein